MRPAQFLLIVIILLAGCSQFEDKHDIEFELNIESEGCEKLVVESTRGEGKNKQGSEQGTSIKIR